MRRVVHVTPVMPLVLTAVRLHGSSPTVFVKPGHFNRRSFLDPQAKSRLPLKNQEAGLGPADPSTYALEEPPPGPHQDPTPWKADAIRDPEFQSNRGQSETRDATRDARVLRYDKYKREPPGETVLAREVKPQAPLDDHHPYFDYRNRHGKREGYFTNSHNLQDHFEIRLATHTLYRYCLKCLPLVKQYYWILMPLDKMKERVRIRFMMNKHVRDPDAIRHLLHSGWVDYMDSISFRRTKGSMAKYFGDSENEYAEIARYTDEEGKLLEERQFFGGSEQRAEGPFKDGHWSYTGVMGAEAYKKLAGRIPMGWHTSKGYFDIHKFDGTNVWEKNMDYEGWYIKNVDPDRQSARKELSSWVQSGYHQPRHYASKNRRAYRRMVKTMEMVMNSTSQEMYAMSREQMYQFYTREECPETNRISAERKLARQDDEMFTTKTEEMDKYMKQVMREMPNPRLWKTDAFYLRLRHLITPLEMNWTKGAIGVEQEKLFNDWISDDVNYTVFNSPEFAAIKEDKKRNPMAKTWADFYREFDPDVPETRLIPWIHKDFDYDRRWKWDEKCMRMKKWVETGDVDFTRPYFDALVFEWQQWINRPEICRQAGAIQRKYSAPRMVQLFRSLNRRMDVAMAVQMRSALEASGKSLKNAADTSAALKAHDWKTFVFDVPPVILPDGVAQESSGLVGRPVIVSESQATAAA